MAFFVNVNGDTVIEPLRSCRTNDDANKYYPPVTAGQHLMAKHFASMSMAKDSEPQTKSVVGNEDGDRHGPSAGVQDEL